MLTLLYLCGRQQNFHPLHHCKFLWPYQMARTVVFSPITPPLQCGEQESITGGIPVMELWGGDFFFPLMSASLSIVS